MAVPFLVAAETRPYTEPFEIDGVHMGAIKTIMSKPGFLGLAVIAAVVLAFMSVRIERIGPELVQYGNLCGPAGLDPCYKPVLKGGFPFAYLFDAPGISREGQLAFLEDRLEVGALVADVAVYVATMILAAWAILRRRLGFETDNVRKEQDDL